ncbi:MAG: Bcr/CflA family multidrug efflux MFS transporter [Opitutaceae bacterium]|nr:Bcr/CflA family multidrug efflux MFS transporter [Opitutaceae bacterium]
MRLVKNKSMPSHGWLVLILGAIAAMVPLSIDMYLPAFPRIAADLGVDVGEVQWTLSIFMIGMAVGQTVYGTLADRFGRRAPLLLGMALFTLGTAGCALAGSVQSLIGWRLGVALGGSAGMVITRAIVRDRFDELESAHFYSTLMLVMGVAPILAPLIGGQLLLLTSWRGIFWLIGVFGAACLTAVWWTLPETMPTEKRVRHNARQIAATYWGLLTHRQFMGYVLAVSCTSGVLFAYIAGSPTLFIEQYGVSAQAFGIFFGANAAGLILTSQLNRGLLKRFSSRQILLACYSLNTVATLLLLAQVLTGWGGFPLALVFLWLSIASAGLIFPNSTALAMSPVGQAAGSASALMGMLQYAVGGIMASLVGALHDGTGRPMAIVIAATSVCGWIFLRSLTRDERISG